jgi:hypothetical protein
MGVPQTLPANFNGWDAAPAASAGSAPPPTLPANFNGWDAPTTPASNKKPWALDSSQKGSPAQVGEDMAELLAGATHAAAKVSGPNIVYEVLRKNFPSLGLKPVLGMPTTNEALSTAVPMIAGGLEAEEATPETAAAKTAPAPQSAPASSSASILEHPGVTPWIEAAKKELMKIPGADLVKTAIKSAKGFAEGTPEAEAAPAVNTLPAPMPSHPTGPPELWGQQIPQSAAQETATPVPQSSAVNIPKRGVPIWRDATRQNVPYAGEDFAATQAVVDKAIPPSGDTLALNKRVQSQINVALSQGDVAGAEKVLDAAAKTASPSYTPPARPRIVPSVQNIREQLAQVADAEAQPNRITPDTMDDAAWQQEMNWDLERHQWAAEAEARREFIARNSTGVTKSELTGAAEKPVRYTKTPGVASSGSVAGDLTDLLQRSLEAAKKAKAQQP